LPDLEELLELRGAARALSWRAHGTAQALLSGSYRSSHRGRGLEFEEVRPYVAGDDPRSIDWRVTARRGRFHTKLFREERERPVWLLVDLDAALFFGTRLQLKSMLAVRAAAMIAWIAALGGDRVGAVIANSHSIRILPARSREAGVLPILNTLVEMQPRSPGAGSADTLLRAVGTLTHAVHPGSLVLALSDFAWPQLSDTALWSAATQHSECRWLWITDAIEEQALPNGRFRAGHPQPVRSVDGASVRREWLAAWQEREARIRSCAQSLRIEVLRLDTASAVADTLAASLSLRSTAA
jgi:uncharacterized protein (DUF58 family)